MYNLFVWHPFSFYFRPIDCSIFFWKKVRIKTFSEFKYGNKYFPPSWPSESGVFNSHFGHTHMFDRLVSELVVQTVENQTHRLWSQYWSQELDFHISVGSVHRILYRLSSCRSSSLGRVANFRSCYSVGKCHAIQRSAMYM